jgi:hypothetical protein
MNETTKQYSSRMFDAGRPESPFRCGFNPATHKFREYVEHIYSCSHRDCQNRAANNREMKAYFADRIARDESSR